MYTHTHTYIYMCTAMAKKCIVSYQTYINQMNNRIRNLFDIENPFDFRHIRYLSSMSEYVPRLNPKP